MKKVDDILKIIKNECELFFKLKKHWKCFEKLEKN
jgi:hypothetical protein